MVFIYTISMIVLLIINLFFLYPYRNKVKLHNIIIVILILFLLSLIRDTPDIDNYILLFKSTYKAKDPGFALIARYFYKKEWDYFQFQTLVYFFSISLIVQGLIRRVEHRTFVYIMYFVYPFLLNVVQLRNMIASAIFVFLLCISPVEINNKKIEKKYLVAWIIILVIASTIHFSICLYIPFIFIKNREKLINGIVIFSLFIFVFLYLSPTIMLSYWERLLLAFEDSVRSNSYLDSSTHLGGWLNLFIAISLFLIVKWIKEFNNSEESENKSSVSEKSFIVLSEKLFKYSIVFCPLYYINGDFARLMQDEMIILYSIISMAIFSYPKRCIEITELKNKASKIRNAFILFLLVMTYNAYTVWIDLKELVVDRVFGCLF